MTPHALNFPPAIAQRLAATETTVVLTGLGNPELLKAPLLGLLCSRDCPARIMLDTLERVSDWARTGQVILSGFHAPLEQQVLRSLLRRDGRAVKLLARGLTDGYRPPAQEAAPLAEGRLLIASTFPATIQRVTRQSALERNRMVLLFAEHWELPYIAPASPLADLIAELRAGLSGTKPTPSPPEDTRMKFFNTEGPVRSEMHYVLPPLERWDLDEVLRMIAQQKYFLLHAPRQTGKATPWK